MKRLSIYKNSVLTNQLDFETQEALEAGLAYHQGRNSFGANAIYGTEEVLISAEVRGETQELVSAAVYNEYDEEISPALYNTNPDGVISPAVYETLTILLSPAEYTIEITDITAQLEQEETNKSARAYLATTDWMVVRAMERGETLSVEFKAERQAARDSIVE